MVYLIHFDVFRSLPLRHVNDYVCVALCDQYKVLPKGKAIGFIIKQINGD